MSAETFSVFATLVDVIRREHPEWRKGQAAFNILAEKRPDLAEQVAGTIRDPFYDDERLPAFWSFVRQGW